MKMEVGMLCICFVTLMTAAYQEWNVWNWMIWGILYICYMNPFFHFWKEYSNCALCFAHLIGKFKSSSCSIL